MGLMEGSQDGEAGLMNKDAAVEASMWGHFRTRQAV